MISYNSQISVLKITQMVKRGEEEDDEDEDEEEEKKETFLF